MKTPKYDWPNKSKTAEIVALSGYTQIEMEQMIKESIRTAEKMAKVGLDHIAPILESPKSKWEKRWFADETLVRWFGKVDKPNHVKDVHRRLEDVYQRIAFEVLTIRIKVDLPKDRHAQNMGWFLWPKAFQVGAEWFDLSLNRRAGVVIHELMHEWFSDQKLNGELVYGAYAAENLAKESPRDARQSPENYENYCRDLYSPIKNSPWKGIGGYFPPGAPVSVVARKPDHLDLFITGNDGDVYSSAWQEGGEWTGVENTWWSLGGEFSAGAQVSAIARTPNDLDLFITGNNGVVYTSNWSPQSDWSGKGNKWTPIGGFFQPGAPVSVVARKPDHLDLFITGNNGVVYTSNWSPQSDWSGKGNKWTPIGGFFQPGAQVSAIARTPNDLDLFITGNNGVVYTSNWSPQSDWSGKGNKWTPIGMLDPVGAPAAAPVGTVARNQNEIDLFITINNGIVHTQRR